MGASADDLELLLSVLACSRPERAAAWSIALPVPTEAALSGDFRIGVWFDDPACRVESGYGALPTRRRRARERGR
jgi:amidase